MPAKIDLQLAELKHQDLVMKLMHEFYLSEHLIFNPRAAHTALLHLIEDRSLGMIYLINTNNETAGYCVVTFGYSLEFHGRFALIDEFYIREAFRGLGIGAAALHFLEDQCGNCESAPSASKSIILTPVLVDYTNGLVLPDTIEI